MAIADTFAFPVRERTFMSLNNDLLSAIMRSMDVDRGLATAAGARAIWDRLTRKFTPLLGPGSTSLLFTRSLDANRQQFAWLPPGEQPGSNPPFMALETCMAERSPEEIMMSTRALLDTYIDMLTTLIGARLTTQFVHAAFPADDAERNTEEKAE